MRWTEAAGALALGMAAMVAEGGGQTAAPALPQPPALPTVPAPVAPPKVQARFVVVLDAAHGGSDSGARLGDNVPEKEITLRLSVHLRSALQARGIEVVTTREQDVDVPLLARAETANHAQAAACLVLHATATGSGVHLFTSSLSPEPAVAGQDRFAAWGTAQAAYVTQSLKLESEIDSALVHTAIPVTLGRASVQPMDSMACPEVAVEMAPLVGGHVTEGRAITDPGYEKQVVDSLAAALEQWRNDWKQ